MGSWYDVATAWPNASRFLLLLAALVAAGVVVAAIRRTGARRRHARGARDARRDGPGISGAAVPPRRPER